MRVSLLYELEHLVLKQNIKLYSMYDRIWARVCYIVSYMAYVCNGGGLNANTFGDQEHSPKILNLPITRGGDRLRLSTNTYLANGAQWHVLVIHIGLNLNQNLELEQDMPFSSNALLFVSFLQPSTRKIVFELECVWNMEITSLIK